MEFGFILTMTKKSNPTTRLIQFRHYTTANSMIFILILVVVLLMGDVESSSSPTTTMQQQPQQQQRSFRLIPSQANHHQQDNNKSKQQRPLSSEYPRTVRVLRSWMIRHNSYSAQQRRLQDYDDKRLAIDEASAKSTSKRNIVGAKLSLKRPTIEQVSKWYNRHNTIHSIFNGGESIEDNKIRLALRAMLQNPFNHDNVGMTNPLLSVFTSTSPSAAAAATCSSTDVILASTKTKLAPTSSETGGGNKDDAWWPGLNLMPDQQRDSSMGDSDSVQLGLLHRVRRRRREHKSEWQVLKYRSYRIGTGHECYKKVRDAALDWSFASSSPSRPESTSETKPTSTTSGGDMGMMEIPDRQVLSSLSFAKSRRRASPSPGGGGGSVSRPHNFRRPRSYERVSLPKEDKHTNNSNSNDNDDGLLHRVRPIWSGPGGRRFATYGSMDRLLGIIPLPSFLRIYAVNPVMSVYDLVDQRYVILFSHLIFQRSWGYHRILVAVWQLVPLCFSLCILLF